MTQIRFHQTAIALLLMLSSIATVFYVTVALAQGVPPTLPDINQQTDQILSLWKVLGWPGLAAGIASLGLSVFRFFTSRHWDSWPRWVRYGLAVTSIGVSASVTAISQEEIITSGVILAAIIKGFLAGMTFVGISEGAKTIKQPHAPRASTSIRTDLLGPNGTNITGGWGS